MIPDSRNSNELSASGRTSAVNDSLLPGRRAQWPQRRCVRRAHQLALIKQARAFARVAPFGRVALLDGSPGVVMAPRGRLVRAVRFTFADNKVTQLEVIADPLHLSRLELSVLGVGK